MLSLLAAILSQTSDAAPADLAARIDAVVKPLVPGRTPGIAVVVERGEATLYRRAFGSADLAGRTPATTATPFKIGSLTKAFTAAVVQGLAGEGKLSLGDDVTKWVAGAPEAWRGITVRDLLHHTSGIASYTDLPGVALRLGGPGSTADVLAAVAKRPLKFSPGERFDYSNTNYYLLGLIAERAGGAPLETLLKRRVFGPLGMTGASLERKGFYRADEARGSYHVGGKTIAMPPAEMSWPYGAGAVVASADDMAKWLAGIAHGRVLTDAQRRETFAPVALKGGGTSFYGYGWILATRGSAPLLAHGGAINGFSSYAAYLPASDVRVVVLTNTFDGVGTERLTNAILDAVEGKTPPKAIADRNPTLTKRLRGVFEALLRGERDDALFAPGFVKAIPKAEYAKIGASLAELGPLAAFELVGEAKSGGGVERSYRASLAEAELTAVFLVDAGGRIAGFRLR